jgi:hypothetical protein
MNLSQLRKIIKEEIFNSLKETKTIEKPGTKEKEKEQERTKKRTMIPGKDAPDSRPKAMMKENEKQMIGKIVDKFKKLSNPK